MGKLTERFWMWIGEHVCAYFVTYGWNQLLVGWLGVGSLKR